ncbi:MAG: hypothetical protein IJV96_03150 [Clostridia bacterium]|nr:hypothetical protein [Clostridia bacterium]
MKDEWLLPVTKKPALRGLLSYLGLVVAAATVLIFSALFFTDLSFSFVSTVNFSLSFFLLLFSSYVIYVSLFETGRAQGEKEERFSTLLSKRTALFEAVSTHGSGASVAAFCRAYSEKETAARRRELLHEHFLDEEALTAIRAKEKRERTRREARALRALDGMKAITLSPRALLAERPAAAFHAPLSLSPDKQRHRRTLSFLLPLALFAALSVSVACEVLLNPSPDAIVGYLLKLFTLLQSGVKGFRAGYFHATEDKAEFLSEQCALLEEYLKEQTAHACQE